MTRMSHPGWHRLEAAAHELAARFEANVHTEAVDGYLKVEFKNVPDRDRDLLHVLADGLERASYDACQICSAIGAKQYRSKKDIVTLCEPCAVELLGFRSARSTLPSAKEEGTLECKDLGTKHRLISYATGIGDHQGPIHLSAHIEDLFQGLHELCGLELGFEEGNVAYSRDRPSWAFEEAQHMLQELFTANPDLQTVRFIWQKETYEATREKSYLTEFEEWHAGVKRDLNRGLIDGAEYTEKVTSYFQK